MLFHEIYDRDNGKCHVCGLAVDRQRVAPHPLAATLDHVWPLALHGRHEPGNVKLAHFLCNCWKSDRAGMSEQQRQLAREAVGLAKLGHGWESIEYPALLKPPPQPNTIHG